MPSLTKRRKSASNRNVWPLSYEELQATRHQIARLTGHLAPAGIKVDMDKLDDDAQRRLRTLTFAERNDAEQAEWEAIVEKTSGMTGVFAKARAAESHRAEMAAMRREVLAMRLTQDEEEGIFAAVYDAVAHDSLRAPTAAVLLMTIIQFQAGRPWSKHAHIDRGEDGPVLVIREGSLVGPGNDPDGVFAGWRKKLAWLNETGWLKVDGDHGGRGRNVRIRLGDKVVKAMAR
jgi:hypothetical protein